MGNEALALNQVFWIITDICVVIVLAVIAVTVLIWWIIKAFDDKHKVKTYKESSTAFAGCADEWLSKYYREKEEHANTVNFYTGALERKDRKIDSLIEFDEKKTQRIIQLEKQLKDNGIEPESWEFAA